MDRNAKMISGIAAFLPIVCFIWAMWSIFSMVTGSIDLAAHKSHNPAAEADMMFGDMRDMILAFIGLTVVSLGVMIYFIIHSVNNKLIDSNEKIVWILVFVFTGMIGFPIYWYLKIWQLPEPETMRA